MSGSDTDAKAILKSRATSKARVYPRPGCHRKPAAVVLPQSAVTPKRLTWSRRHGTRGVHLRAGVTYRGAAEQVLRLSQFADRKPAGSPSLHSVAPAGT